MYNVLVTRTVFLHIYYASTFCMLFVSKNGLAAQSLNEILIEKS